MFQSFDQTTDKSITADRVAALRAELTTTGVNGFLVPRSDAHQGEFVAPHDERLSWICGFTGSAGIAVVMDRRAALFVDGRYTLQASNQVDTEIFEIVAIHKTSVSEWMDEALQQDDRIAYDPWLHGRAEIERMRKVAKLRGAAMVSLPSNPIDAAWSEQPPVPCGAVRVHPIEVAGEAAGEKRKRIGAEIAEQGANFAVLSLPDSIAWLLNVRGSDVVHSPVAHGFALAHSDGRVDLVMDPDKLDGAVRAHLGNEVTLHNPDELSGLLQSVQGPVLLDEATCPLWFSEQIAATEAEVIWGTDPCVLPKAQKNDAELQGMRDAHDRDGVAIVRFLAWLDGALADGQTLTEIEIAERLEAFRAADGDLLDISFDTICGSGPNGAIVHYRVNRDSNRTLIPGDLLLVDSGAQYPDGTTDITRTMATGPVTPEQRKHFTLVLKGMIAISVTRWPAGLSGRDLDALARSALWRAGLDYDHGTGHGVGACLNVHEGPQSLSRRGTAELLPGMILSNEPGFYLEGAYGIRIENLEIVSEPSVPQGGLRPMLGFETLTWAPIDRRLIDISLLTDDETAWLDEYHREVLRRVRPALDTDTADWLEKACAPLGKDTYMATPKFTVEPAAGTIVIRAGGAVVAESAKAVVLREGDYDPVFYLPREDAGLEFLERSETVTHCPHKGDATHYTFIAKSGPIVDAAWSYESPLAGAEAIAGYVAFYAGKVTIETL